MQSQAGSFIKGLGTGMVAGAVVDNIQSAVVGSNSSEAIEVLVSLGFNQSDAALVVGKVVMQDHKNITKGSAKLVKAVGDFVDGVQTMFR